MLKLKKIILNPHINWLSNSNLKQKGLQKLRATFICTWNVMAFHSMQALIAEKISHCHIQVSSHMVIGNTVYRSF